MCLTIRQLCGKMLNGEGWQRLSLNPQEKQTQSLADSKSFLHSKEKNSMKSIGIVRNIDELGRIVIPKELRNKMDMHEGSSVEIFAQDNNICIRRYYAGCHFCGNGEGLVEFKEKLICRSCLDELSAK